MKVLQKEKYESVTYDIGIGEKKVLYMVKKKAQTIKGKTEKQTTAYHKETLYTN